MDGFGLVRHQKSPLESKIHLFSQSLPGFCTWLRDFPLRTFPLNIVHKYFQETNKLLFGFCLYFVLFFLFLKKNFWMAFQQGTLLLWVSSAGWGGRGLLFLGLGSLFGWLLTLLLLSFPSISGSLGKWLVPCFVFFDRL